MNINDRRRVTMQGAVRKPYTGPLPVFQYREIRTTLENVWRHISTHLNRGLNQGTLAPINYWWHLWGLALSTHQTYSAIALLLAERNRPNTLPLQASVLVRSELEALGNVMALTANPKAIRWFLADGYRNQAQQMRVLRERFGDQPKWKPWLDQMDKFSDMMADDARLGKRRRKHLNRIPEWPTPHWLTHPKGFKGRKRPLPVLLKGNRARLFKEAYSLWYSQLSSYAHQRAGATILAAFSNRPDLHDELGKLESNVISEALLFYACVMSELEKAAGMPPSADLRTMWLQLWKLDDYSKRFATIRYRRLLGLPRIAPS